MTRGVILFQTHGPWPMLGVFAVLTIASCKIDTAARGSPRPKHPKIEGH